MSDYFLDLSSLYLEKNVPKFKNILKISPNIYLTIAKVFLAEVNLSSQFFCLFCNETSVYLFFYFTNILISKLFYIVLPRLLYVAKKSVSALNTTMNSTTLAARITVHIRTAVSMF